MCLEDTSYMYKRSSNVIVFQKILSKEIIQHILSKNVSYGKCSLSDMRK